MAAATRACRERCGTCAAAVGAPQVGPGGIRTIECGRALQRIKFLNDNRGSTMSVDGWCPLWPWASVSVKQQPQHPQTGGTTHDR